MTKKDKEEFGAMLAQLEYNSTHMKETCDGSCSYNEVCDKTECLIEREMAGLPLPPAAQKIDDRMWEDNLYDHEQRENKSKASIELWLAGAHRVANCQVDCIFGKCCNKDLMTIKKKDYCYGEIVSELPRRFTKKEIFSVPSEVLSIVKDFFL